jgi:hypothetical protein
MQQSCTAAFHFSTDIMVTMRAALAAALEEAQAAQAARAE